MTALLMVNTDVPEEGLPLAMAVRILSVSTMAANCTLNRSESSLENSQSQTSL